MRFVRFVEVWAVCMVLLLAGLLVGGLSCSHATAGGQAPAADDNHLSPAQRDVTSPRVLAADWPVAWTWYRTVNGLEQDLADLKAHGIQSIGGPGVRGGANAAQTLALARRFGMKLHIGIPEITENGNQVRAQGLEPQWAVMIGGCYRGRAIDRHLFAFTPEEHSIIIESPVYNQGLPYTTTVDGKTEGSGHYMTEARSQTMPLRAEVVVPLGRFDGRQHLQIVPATIEEAPPDSKLEIDSTEGLPGVSEIRNRHVYRVGFDLRGLPSGAMLDKVGIAVYWTYGSQVSARAESTRQAMRILTRGNLEPWAQANGGTFPGDVVQAARYGDETFYRSCHVTTGPAVSFPLWDYSEAGIAEFHKHLPGAQYPRTWGYPEIYGPDTYAWWMYLMQQGCAELAGVSREEIAKIAPGLMLFRNTTRMGVFDLSNDHDGSGQELLTQNLDFVHLDPYPARGGEYDDTNIPSDMSYMGGLARRYRKPLVPWMQAHSYAPGGLSHPTPEQIRRMCDQQWAQGVDGIIWLGYGPGHTFPRNRADSWDAAAEFHRKLQAQRPPKPIAKMAVLRPYRTWAQSSLVNDKIRNPADWMLQQLLEVWSVKHGQPYDVFELPPGTDDAARAKLASDLSRYSIVVSTMPRDGAWLIGQGTETTEVDPATAPQVQADFERQLRDRGLIR